MADDGKDKLQRMMDDLAAKQRNILWPQSLKNGRSVDAFLWKGAEKPTASMRIGAFLLGTIYLIAALGICYASAEGGSICVSRCCIPAPDHDRRKAARGGAHRRGGRVREARSGGLRRSGQLASPGPPGVPAPVL